MNVQEWGAFTPALDQQIAEANAGRARDFYLDECRVLAGAIALGEFEPLDATLDLTSGSPVARLIGPDAEGTITYTGLTATPWSLVLRVGDGRWRGDYLDLSLAIKCVGAAASRESWASRTAEACSVLAGSSWRSRAEFADCFFHLLRPLYGETFAHTVFVALVSSWTNSVAPPLPPRNVCA